MIQTSWTVVFVILGLSPMVAGSTGWEIYKEKGFEKAQYLLNAKPDPNGGMEITILKVEGQQPETIRGVKEVIFKGEIETKVDPPQNPPNLESATATQTHPVLSKEISAGKTYYIPQGPVTVSEESVAGSDTVMILGTGQQVTLLGQEGEWLLVGIPLTGGKTGWIEKSALFFDSISPIRPPKGGVESHQYEGTEEERRAFGKFLSAFNHLNRRIKEKGGVTFFSGAKYLGDGIVHVTATDLWLNEGTLEQQRSNLDTLFKLWEGAEGTGLPIALYIVDSAGKVVMKKSGP